MEDFTREHFMRFQTMAGYAAFFLTLLLVSATVLSPFSTAVAAVSGGGGW